MFERLTYKAKNRLYALHKGGLPENVQEAFARLAEYEDTELSPKAIIELNDFEKTQCAKLIAKLSEYTNSGLSLEEAREIAK